MKKNSHLSLLKTKSNRMLSVIILSSLVNFSLFAQERSITQVDSQQVETPAKLHKITQQEHRAPVVNNPIVQRFQNWGIDASLRSSINIQNVWQKFDQKREVVVAVIDTGIDPNHPFLRDNLYIPQGQASAENFGLDFSVNRSDINKPTDAHGHGTHVSGIIRSVFPQVRLLTLKYYNPHASGQDNLNSTIQALRYAVEQNVDIINYSGGGPEPSKEELRILKEAERKGILVIAAAGNEENNIDHRAHAYYPASYGLSNIISVAAHDQNLRMINSSNYGARSVHLSAPGHRIRSSLPGDRAGYLTGTSQATAFVSGVAALLMSQYPELSPSQIRDVIVQSAIKEDGLRGRILSEGRLDADSAFKLAQSKIDRPTSRREIANRTPDSLETKEEAPGIIRLRSGQPMELGDLNP